MIIDKSEKVRHKIETKPNQQRREDIIRWCTPRCDGRPILSGNGQNGMMSALWGMGCEEDSEYHKVVGTGQVVKVAGQFVKFEWLKVKLG